MRLLFCSNYPHLPDVIGGLQTATDELCAALLDRGVEPLVLCGRYEGSGTGPRHFDYKVVRAENPEATLPLIAATFEPTAIIVQNGFSLFPMVKAALATGRPTAIYMHNLEVSRLGGNLVAHPDLLYIANSPYTAARLEALADIQALVVPPAIQPQRYIVEATGDRVLFVNPTLVKGFEIVFKLARRHPEIPFTIVESWSLDPAWRSYQKSRCADLPNIEWLDPVEDMRGLFAKARLLLMPSLWEEAYGRTVIEAQLNGLPVIASNRGALPDTVGEGGMIVDAHAPLDDWSHALGLLYHDPMAWQMLSAQARDNARLAVMAGHLAIDRMLTRLASRQPPS
ncbi:glycosyltransferase [Lacibacterium aquatile]|uniref:Glycosyltransferase n=1 Tax=Lacibacterium aquatile TaxID=1168082 RepID=A0ABW5DK86_9PROT